MIEETAVVVEVNGDQVLVESEIKSACSSCQQVSSCGSGQVAKAFPSKKVQYSIASNKSLSVGDRVVIGLSESVVLSAAWQVYLWPIFGLILGGVIGQLVLVEQWAMHEFFGLAVSLLGGYLGFRVARKAQCQHEKHENWRPQLLKLLPRNISVQQIDS